MPSIQLPPTAYIMNPQVSPPGAFNITRLAKYEWPEANIQRLNLAYYNKSIDINL